MKRFAFRLESVLKFRRFELEECQRDLALVLKQLAEVEHAIEQASVAASERAADFIARVRRGVASERLGLAQLGIEQAFRSWRGDQVSREGVKIAVARAREEVTRAHTGVRALEKLRERAIERHRADCAREEVGNLDEVAGRMRSLGSRFVNSHGDSAGRAS